MKSANPAALRVFALIFLLPGLAGLILSAMISMHYLDTLPRIPDPPALRDVPRNIHGVVVYQTAEENRNLNLIEYTSVGIFVVGLALGIVYLEKWGAAQTRAAEEERTLARDTT